MTWRRVCIFLTDALRKIFRSGFRKYKLIEKCILIILSPNGITKAVWNNKINEIKQQIFPQYIDIILIDSNCALNTIAIVYLSVSNVFFCTKRNI